MAAIDPRNPGPPDPWATKDEELKRLRRAMAIFTTYEWETFDRLDGVHLRFCHLCGNWDDTGHSDTCPAGRAFRIANGEEE